MGRAPLNLGRFGVPTGLGSLFTQRPYGVSTAPKPLARTAVAAPGGGLRIMIPSPYLGAPPTYLGISPQTVGAVGITFQTTPDGKIITINTTADGQSLVWRIADAKAGTVTEQPYVQGQVSPGSAVVTTAPTGQLVTSAPPPAAVAPPAPVTNVSDDYAAEVRRVMTNIASTNSRLAHEIQTGATAPTELPPDALLPAGETVPFKVTMASLFGGLSTTTVLIGASVLGLLVLWRFRE